MPLQANRTKEPIPGYRVRERIGAGGYGEVWATDAPGGLAKAIKFVYGYLDEDRAACELKALNRIKAVRHPFLLSLERIEVVDGQLLIVTELAEGSLKDRYDALKKRGARGIPWDELIRYMRDAADVLDYMSEEHSLQHLDVKPENLLLLANRVKVADFGLVKDIHDATASLMGGLTPLYAPPEVFDGRPSRWSDQYSLAIVYQEMLTGELPFPGTTAIQLARQHLNSQPQLAALSEHDRAVVGRALSKKPEERFSNCREFVDALEFATPLESARSEFKNSAKGRGAARSGPAPRRDPPPLAEAIPRDRQDLQDGNTSDAPVARILPTPTVTVLPAVELPPQTVSITPTLFLGVGRSAATVLVRLRRRLEDRFGWLNHVPSIQTLLLDTNSRDLQDVVFRGAGGLGPQEILHLPLRKSNDYREDSKAILKWLNRRWLFNIPRSLSTDGLRPLGRLALIDHAQRVRERIGSAIAAATATDAAQISSETTGHPIDPTMRIVLVSSIAGGTGSGMLVDLGYLAQQLLAEAGFPRDNVCGVLTHSTGRNPRTRELSIVNAYSTLSELNHFGRRNGCYPGDSHLQVPRSEQGGAFQHTYLVHLGDRLNEQQFSDAADRVSEFLYLDSATHAGNFFQAFRDAQPGEQEMPHEEIHLRSFGLRQFSCLQNEMVDVAVEHLCRYSVNRWLMGTTMAGDPPTLRRENATVSRHADQTQDSAFAWLEAVAAEFANSLKMDHRTLTNECRQLIESRLDSPIDDLVRKELDCLPLKENANSPEVVIRDFQQRIHELLGLQDQAVDTQLGGPALALARFEREAVVGRSKVIRDWLLARVEDENKRVRGAQWLSQWLAEYCDLLIDTINRLRTESQQDFAPLNNMLEALQIPRTRKGKIDCASLREGLARYASVKLSCQIFDSVTAIAKAIKAHVNRAEDELIEFGRKLQQVANQFDTTQTLDRFLQQKIDPTDTEYTGGFATILIEQLDSLAKHIVRPLTTEILEPRQGLRNMLSNEGSYGDTLPKTLRELVRHTVVSWMKKLDATELLLHDEAGDAGDVNTLRIHVEAAMPDILTCGGARRLLVMLPLGSSNVRPIEILRHHLKEMPSLAENVDGDFVLCHEVEQISLTQVAVTLIQGRPDYADYASRLHTRTDVAWSPLPDIS